MEAGSFSQTKLYMRTSFCLRCLACFPAVRGRDGVPIHGKAEPEMQPALSQGVPATTKSERLQSVGKSDHQGSFSY